jgi:hypothetical protein
MSDPRDKRSQEPPAPTETTDDPQADKRSGRISYDERGNSVWEWQLETGVYSRDISTQRLKKLDLDDLSIADTAINQRPPGLDQPARKQLPGGGSNPYDNSSSTRGNVAPSRAKESADPYNSGGKAPLKPAADPNRKPTDLKKLQEWMELRKRVEQNKRDDEE